MSKPTARNTLFLASEKIDARLKNFLPWALASALAVFSLLMSASCAAAFAAYSARSQVLRKEVFVLWDFDMAGNKSVDQRFTMVVFLVVWNEGA